MRVSSPNGALAAQLYEPVEERRGVALVLLPLGEERKGCVRVVHELGLALAENGWSLLWGDYAGSGESPGSFDEMTWDGLVADAAALLAMADELANGVPVAVAGFRLGARVAFELAATDEATLSALWLVEPVTDAGKWLHETSRRSRFRGTGGELSDGGLDLDGYAFSAAFCEELRALPSLPEPKSEGWPPTRILQVGHRDSPARPLAELARALGSAEGLDCLQDAPFWLETDVVDTGALCERARGFFTSLDDEMECG